MSDLVVEDAAPAEAAIDHGNGDYTIVLSAMIPGATVDPVARDYSFLEDSPQKESPATPASRSGRG